MELDMKKNGGSEVAQEMVCSGMRDLRDAISMLSQDEVMEIISKIDWSEANNGAKRSFESDKLMAERVGIAG